jgi:hypothetical protein
MRLLFGRRLRVGSNVRVEKDMGLTLSEFQLTLARLTGTPLAHGQTSALIGVGAGNVVVDFGPRPPLRLSALLKMPRALVSLTFSNVTDVERLEFLKRFDITFHRGGG